MIKDRVLLFKKAVVLTTAISKFWSLTCRTKDPTTGEIEEYQRLREVYSRLILEAKPFAHMETDDLKDHASRLCVFAQSLDTSFVVDYIASTLDNKMIDACEDLHVYITN